MSSANAHRLGHYPPANFPRPVRAIAALSRLLALLEGVGIAVCLTSLVGLAVFEFASRNLRGHHQLWFPDIPVWTDGVIRHSVFVLGFLGAAYATFTGRHIRIDAFTRTVGVRNRLRLRVITTLAAIALLALLERAAFDFYKVCLEEQGEASMQGQLFTSARGALIIMGGLGLIAFHFLVQVLLDLTFLVKSQTPPPTWIAEAHGGDSFDDPAASPLATETPEPSPRPEVTP